MTVLLRLVLEPQGTFRYSSFLSDTITGLVEH